MGIEIKLVNGNDIVPFWSNSSQSSAFTHPQVLGKLSKTVDWWIAKKGKQIQCVWPVCKPDGEKIGLPALTYFVGPFWLNDVYPLPAHRSLARSTEVYSGFIERFLSEYGAIEASLPKGLHDIRIFDWWNYHEKDQPRFRIRPRYTACIDHLQEKTELDIISDFRQLRRRELRAIEKSPPPARTVDWKADDLIKLYLQVVDDQVDEIIEENCQKIPALVDLVNLGYGEVIAYQDLDDHGIIAACLLLYGHSEANMVLNLVDMKWRGTGLAAWMIKESIRIAKAKGMATFDFNGANSPNRGDDKHSYGAAPSLYFEINYPG
ncbi:MAG: hypothetical protein GX142_08585 [Chloroflexi bacterium]|jgi:hypothetical protein|nr:hypothetical protein [Chloroflexota bacterium]